MNLVIDIGNTFTKAELFQDIISVGFSRFKNPTLPRLLKHIAKIDPAGAAQSVIISSVAADPSALCRYFTEKGLFCVCLSHNTPLPIKNHYATPETLGKDRLAAAVAAAHLFPRQNVLSIDMGTCIKYDFVNKNGEYRGGAISPGIEMRFKALHTFTEKLPLIHIKKARRLTGTTTEESISSGVYHGVSAEINGIILKYNKIYKNLILILSGGGMKNFDNNLNFSIFALPNVVTFGLNIILEYNKYKQI